MKDKTITFGIFYDIFAGLSILSSEAGSKTEDKSSSSCCPPPSITLHYPHNQVFYCRDRAGYEYSWERRSDEEEDEDVFTVPGGGPY